MSEDKQQPKSLHRRYHDWINSWSDKAEAEKSLAGFSFAESSFFPIPIDPLLITLILNRPKKTWKLVNITTISSILGGVLGYFIGALLMQSVGQWIVDTYNLQEGFNSLGESYKANAFLAVITAALTPVPYKIITISAGAFSINLVSFVLASLIGRYARYGLVGWFSKILSERYRHKIELFINLLSVGVIFLIILIIVGINLS